MYAGDLFCRVGVYTPSPEATCVLCTQAYVIKITKFRDLGTPLIAIFTSAVREPAHSKGYNASPPPQKKKQVGHPCYKNLNPKFTFTLYI